MRALIGSDVLVLLATLLISLAFWQMALANYLLFHTVIELLSIVIGAMVFFIIAWIASGVCACVLTISAGARCRRASNRARRE